MKRLAIVLIASLGFCQVDWQIETIDSIIDPGDIPDFCLNSLALDGYDGPHIVYNKDGYEKIIYASKVDTVWQRELVDSGLVYGSFSLIFDDDNNAHLSYYQKDDALNMTYVCHAQRDTSGWLIDVVDSIYGVLTNYWFLWGYLKTSLALDTANLPGIAYTSWNLSDSLFYIKYARFDGLDWDTSLVEYDSAWAPHTRPSDWSPVLRFNSENTPVIAFHQVYSSYCDTIKLALYDDSLNEWIIEPAICDPGGGRPVSLALNSQDYPCIAHGWWADVAYSWWDGVAWHTEPTGATMGWIGVRIVLDLDGLDNPHIMYLPDPTIGYACYSYKHQGFWYNCGPIDPVPDLYNAADISLALDTNDQPHVCCQFLIYGSGWNLYGIKYARGTFVGIEEDNSIQNPGNQRLEIHPNPFRDKIYIKFQMPNNKLRTIKIYNSAGQLVNSFNNLTGRQSPITQIIWDGKDYSDRPVSAGIYFVRLETPDYTETRKIMLLK
jgi:hypothetical protein